MSYAPSASLNVGGPPTIATVIAPAGVTPLRSAALTGLVQSNTPLALTSVPPSLQPPMVPSLPGIPPPRGSGGISVPPIFSPGLASRVSSPMVPPTAGLPPSPRRTTGQVLGVPSSGGLTPAPASMPVSIMTSQGEVLVSAGSLPKGTIINPPSPGRPATIASTPPSPRMSSVRPPSPRVSTVPPSPRAVTIVSSIPPSVRGVPSGVILPPSPRVGTVVPSIPMIPPSVSRGPPSPRMPTLVAAPANSLPMIPPPQTFGVLAPQVLSAPVGMPLRPPSPRGPSVVPPSPRATGIPTIIVPPPSPRGAPSGGVLVVPTVPMVPTLPGRPGMSQSTQGSLVFPSLRTPLGPPSLRSAEVKTYQGIIQDNSVELELLRSGYVPLGKVIVQDPEGNREAKYVKALNKLGQSVFVHLDTEGYISMQSNDLTMVEAKSATVVPYSIKMGAFECAGLDVCGVAFECGDSVCTLAREGMGTTPKETSFVYAEQRAEKAAVLNDGVIACPIVRLSEIRANPTQVLQNTDMATRRIRNAAYKSTLTEYAAFRQSVAELNKATQRFDEVRNNSFNRLTKSLDELEGLNARFMKLNLVSEGNKQKYREILYNLRRRNELVIVLLRSTKRVASYKTPIAQITKEINELAAAAESEFRGIDFVLKE